MALDNEQLRQTEQRFAQRRGPRDETARKIRDYKSPLRVDTPERVQRRIRRLGLRPPAGIAPEALNSGHIDIAAAGADPARRVGFERVLGTNDLMGISFLEMGVQVARSVCRILIKQGGQLVGYGTGFLVSPRLLMTNNHVLRSPEEASTSEAEFNYQTGLDGRNSTSVVARLLPQEFFVTDPHLDYTVVAVAARTADGTDTRSFGWNRLIEAQGKILLGEFMNVIQHPNGEPKQLALRENQLIDLLDDFLHYHTDTAPGSSGSPVFNDQWEVVALHHSGVPKTDAQGNYLTPDGAIWRPSMGEHRIAWIANEGARVSQIVAHLKRQNLSPAQRHLLAAMFEEAVPVGGGHLGRSVDHRDLPTGTSTLGARGAVPQADGSVLWTIPINVRVHVGDVGTPVSVQTGTTTGGSAADRTGLIVSGDTASDELRQALAELEDSQTKPYYDADADEASRAAYYQGIANNVTPAARYRALNELLTRTHTTQPAYKPARHVYPWVDLRPNRMIRSIYSGREFSPQELIQEDFRVEAARAVRLRERLIREVAPTQEAIEHELDLLEAQLPYNCEHVVPQSWFEKHEPMRGDIHHLFACEKDCNSFRSNIPYFDFPDFEEAIRDECGKRLDNRFEPEAGKGEVARATLYFLLRYPGEINRTSQEYEADRLQTLLDWHRNFPVSEYERHRNAAIFEKQGNRNPLIDFPEWADEIDFALGLG